MYPRLLGQRHRWRSHLGQPGTLTLGVSRFPVCTEGLWSREWEGGGQRARAGSTQTQEPRGLLAMAVATWDLVHRWGRQRMEGSGCRAGPLVLRQARAALEGGGTDLHPGAQLPQPATCTKGTALTSRPGSSGFESDLTPGSSLDKQRSRLSCFPLETRRTGLTRSPPRSRPVLRSREVPSKFTLPRLRPDHQQGAAETYAASREASVPRASAAGDSAWLLSRVAKATSSKLFCASPEAYSVGAASPPVAPVLSLPRPGALRFPPAAPRCWTITDGVAFQAQGRPRPTGRHFLGPGSPLGCTEPGSRARGGRSKKQHGRPGLQIC